MPNSLFTEAFPQATAFPFFNLVSLSFAFPSFTGYILKFS